LVYQYQLEELVLVSVPVRRTGTSLPVGRTD